MLAAVVTLIVLTALLAIALTLLTVRYRRMKGLFETRKDQFAVLAHEIKTPLALIAAASEMMLNEAPGPLTGDQVAFMRDIDSSASRMGLLADNILTEGKLQEGVFSPTLAEADIRDIVREVWRSMRRLAEQQDQQIALDYPQRMDLALIDAVLIRQAITNLVQNAIRHTSKGGIVTLRAFQNETEIVISVWDDGAGMAPDDRKDAFQRYVSNAGGTGLGLTIVETIASIHGGSVKVDTSLGQGAAFLLVLPRKAS